MSADRIEAGDVVHVDINAAQITLSSSATVLHVPAATGDSWVFRDNGTGNLLHVSEGCTVERVQP